VQHELLALLGGARKRWAMSMWNGRKTVRMMVEMVGEIFG
jgi:hypothetical protein